LKASSKDQPGKFLQIQTARRYTAKPHKGVDRLGIQALSKVEHKMVELKAKVDNLDPIREKLIRLTAQRIGTFQQTDIYFTVLEGRLKLRKTRDHDKAELVYYERENVADVKESRVFILKTQNPAQFENLLKKVARAR